MQKIIFSHQGKSGGTTLINALKKKIGKNQSYHDIDARHKHQMNEEEVRDFRKKFTDDIYQDRAEYQFIYGHFPPKKYKKTFPDALYITFFRHPVEQVLSLYYYWLRKPDRNSHPYRDRLINEKMDVIEFAEMVNTKKNITAFINNRAIENYNFIGITESYNKSVELFKRMYMNDLDIEAVSERVNPEKTLGARYDLDEKTTINLNNILEKKILLYEGAVELFNTQCKEYDITLNSDEQEFCSRK